MWNWLKRLFPESIFARKIDPSAERRLRLAQARAEESIIRAHVDNALMFVDTLAEDMTFDRAIDSYIRQMAIPEPLASTVATRTLVVLGQDLVPYRRRSREDAAVASEASRPALRLGDAADARRGVKRA
ncbi:MAG TPA: hypothetical protein VL328_12775 [Gemmatimonadaceae bacterium]|jgi:hypothetical protein|nr:hypothetical protein [Gemmatimonadaceae bacterium]